MKNLLLILPLAALLAGCTSIQTGSQTDYGAYPTNYTDIVHIWIKNNFKDPDSVKDLEIFKPVKFNYRTPVPIWETANDTYGYAICFSCNAKNSYGAYVGIQTSRLFVRDGIVLQETELTGN